MTSSPAPARTSPPTTARGIDRARAHLLDRRTVAWPAGLVPEDEDWSLELWASPSGGMSCEHGEMRGGEMIGRLELDPAGLTAEQTAVRRHLRDHLALHPVADAPAADPERLADALRGQLLVALRGASGAVEIATGVQVAGVIDDLWGAAAASREDHGVRVGPDGVHLALWAPTALTVDLLLFADDTGAGEPERHPLTREDDGTWTIAGPSAWTDRAYLFDIDVYAPWADAVARHRVTDPLSVGLTAGSEASVIVDLADPRWMPSGWREHRSPVLARPSARAITELHVRDVSIADETVPEELRGTYAAFTCTDSAGMRHLAALAEAGMTTIHLLPTYDIASIPGRRADQARPAIPADAAPDSPAPQAAIAEVADRDAFNWGYDPHHWTVPEASYAPEGHQDGGARTAQFRAMVQALHGIGLQVVADQVFNHTFASGGNELSVLDRVVPGYFHRLSDCGCIEQSTCCENVATEHAMAARIMVDSLVTWARDYRVDGFRFDLMGHHTTGNMAAIRRALDALTLERDGVDGCAVHLYGEGWNFGEVADGARFDQAIQGNLGGTGIGCFDDRIRDAVHGGGPADADHRAEQGFGTGLFTDPNGFDPRSGEEQRAALAHATDLVRLAMAGNLKSFELTCADGQVRRGDELDYAGMPAGFAEEVGEAIAYVDAHDNETLFDTLVWKLPDAISMDDRIRMNILCLATDALGQSPAFWHGGTELLRSKSLDTDSYNSGDRFNAIDWTGASHGFGRGLPPAARNAHLWEAQAPLLRRADLVPSREQILHARDMALDLLRLRRDLPLLTLGSAAAIREKVTFPGAGPDATPGLLVMRIDDRRGEPTDGAHATDTGASPGARTAAAASPDAGSEQVFVVLNASPAQVTEALPGMAGEALHLADVQARGADPVVRETVWDAASGTITVPARTAAVLVG